MTSPAPPVPQRLTPRPPPRQRTRKVAGAVGALLVLVAVAAGLWLESRDDGPLANDVSESIGVGRHPGEVWTYGNPTVSNTGQKAAVVTRIWLVDPTPGLKVLATRVAGPDRKLLLVASAPEWPADGLTDLRPVEGFNVAPRSRPAGERGVELVFSLRADKPGRYVSRAVGIDYTVDGDEHRTYLSYGLGVCVTAAAEPLDRNCRAPETLTPDEIDE